MTELNTLIEAETKIAEAYELLQELYDENTQNRHPDIAGMMEKTYRASVDISSRISFLKSMRRIK